MSKKRKGNDEEPIKQVEDVDRPASPTLKDYQPDFKRKEVLRILRWSDLAYYEILGVETNAPPNVIRRAAKTKKVITHSDQNDDPHATKAFQSAEAYDTLGDEEKRKIYDNDRERLIAENKIFQEEFNETFEQGAYAPDNDRDAGRNDCSDADDEKPMSKEKEAIIDEMTPVVVKLIESPNKNSKAELKRLADKMFKQNESEGGWLTSHLPPINSIHNFGKARKKYLSTFQTNDGVEAEKARKELMNLQTKLESQLEALQLPRTWALKIPPQVNSGGRSAKEPSQNQYNGGRAKEAGVSNQTASDGGGEPMDLDWRPGLTSKFKRILAYRPICTTHREKGTGRYVEVENVYDYVIESGIVNNPIKLVTEDEVGAQAARAYLDLPDDKKVSITRNDLMYKRRDREHIGDVKGFSRKKMTPSGDLPFGVVLVEYAGHDRIMSRSGLRKAIGKTAADQRIDQYLLSIKKSQRGRLKSCGCVCVSNMPKDNYHSLRTGNVSTLIAILIAILM